MNMQNLMAQAQRMQRDIMKKKEEVGKQLFTGKDDIEVLQDMIMIATNDAIKNVDQAMEKAMGQYGSALNGLF